MEIIQTRDRASAAASVPILVSWGPGARVSLRRPQLALLPPYAWVYSRLLLLCALCCTSISTTVSLSPAAAASTSHRTGTGGDLAKVSQPLLPLPPAPGFDLKGVVFPLECSAEGVHKLALPRKTILLVPPQQPPMQHLYMSGGVGRLARASVDASVEGLRHPCPQVSTAAAAAVCTETTSLRVN